MKIVEIPSLIDMHVHFRQPGFEYKETIKTGLKSAFKGGFGGVCTMPNTKPVCDNIETLNFILNEAKNSPVALYPVCAVTKNLNSKELVDFEKLSAAGAVAFSNDGLPILDKNVFENALKSGKLILSHCEDETNEVKWQIESFEKVLKEGFSPKLHFCHISKAKSVDLIRNAKKKGLKITAETAPHYFTLTNKNVDGTGRFKMNPPLGDENDKKAVIAGVLDGTIDVIATDHAPHSKAEKLSSYENSPNGIVGLETAFSLAFMQFGLDVAIEKMAICPRKILDIKNDTKVKFDLDKKWVVLGANFASKCKITPFEGKELWGVKIDD